MMYKYTRDGLGIIRVADGAIIPNNTPANSDYAACMAWVALGNVIAPADPAPAVAPEVQRLIDDTTAAKAYAKLQALAGMSPQQIQTWTTNNVTDLASARDAITTLAIAVSVLYRKVQ